MEHGVADDDVEPGVGERHALDGVEPDLFQREAWRQRRSHLAHVDDRLRVLVDGVDVEALAQEVHEVASAAAAGVEHAHAWTDAAAEQLIEQVDVDVTELRLQIHQTARRVTRQRSRCRRASATRRPTVPRTRSTSRRPAARRQGSALPFRSRGRRRRESPGPRSKAARRSTASCAAAPTQNCAMFSRPCTIGRSGGRIDAFSVYTSRAARPGSPALNAASNLRLVASIAARAAESS